MYPAALPMIAEICSILDNHQQWMDEWMRKMYCTHHGVLLSHKECHDDICRKMDGDTWSENKDSLGGIRVCTPLAVRQWTLHLTRSIERSSSSINNHKVGLGDKAMKPFLHGKWKLTWLYSLPTAKVHSLWIFVFHQKRKILGSVSSN